MSRDMRIARVYWQGEGDEDAVERCTTALATTVVLIVLTLCFFRDVSTSCQGVNAPRPAGQPSGRTLGARTCFLPRERRERVPRSESVRDSSCTLVLARPVAINSTRLPLGMWITFRSRRAGTKPPSRKSFVVSAKNVKPAAKRMRLTLEWAADAMRSQKMKWSSSRP